MIFHFSGYQTPPAISEPWSAWTWLRLWQRMQVQLVTWWPVWMGGKKLAGCLRKFALVFKNCWMVAVGQSLKCLKRCFFPTLLPVAEGFPLKKHAPLTRCPAPCLTCRLTVTVPKVAARPCCSEHSWFFYWLWVPRNVR